MEKRTVTAQDLHKTLGKALKEAASQETVTLVTYHGVPSAAIVPITGIYGWYITQALESAGSRDYTNTEDTV